MPGDQLDPPLSTNTASPSLIFSSYARRRDSSSLVRDWGVDRLDSRLRGNDELDRGRAAYFTMSIVSFSITPVKGLGDS
jgi:hypothetical protein